GLSIGHGRSARSKLENQVVPYGPLEAVGEDWRPGVDAGTYYSGGIKALRRTGNAKRDGLMATVQYRPNNTWTSTLDAFYTDAEEYDTDRKSTRLNSSHVKISYAVFCWKKKNDHLARRAHAL